MVVVKVLTEEAVLDAVEVTEIEADVLAVDESVFDALVLPVLVAVLLPDVDVSYVVEAVLDADDVALVEADPEAVLVSVLEADAVAVFDTVVVTVEAAVLVTDRLLVDVADEVCVMLTVLLALLEPVLDCVVTLQVENAPLTNISNASDNDPITDEQRVEVVTTTYRPSTQENDEAKSGSSVHSKTTFERS